MAKWLLPDNFADILPDEARALELMRRRVIDLFKVHGFELVQPPLIEYVDSLLTGSGSDLEQNTFEFMDCMDGRLLGLRSDMTPQAARIDAHILNAQGVTRLCYAGSCVHAHPRQPLASREPFVAGAELFGIRAEEADAEMLLMAVKTLRSLGLKALHLDIGHMAVVRSILAHETLGTGQQEAILSALKTKDPVALENAGESLSEAGRTALELVMNTFGDPKVLDTLEKGLAAYPEVSEAVDEVRRLAQLSGADAVSVDFSDVHGYQYLTGISFAVNLPGFAEPVLRGGRYDGIGLAFGRSRPACGFTVYLRELSKNLVGSVELPEAIIAAEEFSPAYESAVEQLRLDGRTVIRLFPGEMVDNVRKRFNVTHALVRQGSEFKLQVI